MAGGFYEPEEFRGAPVYDSEGYLYGRVCGFEFREEPMLRVCIEASAATVVPDVERLRGLLEARGLELRGDEPLEELVLLAREQGLDVPLKRAEKPVSIVKGFVSPSEIAVVDRAEASGLIVLLSRPREARFRGLRERREPPKPGPGLVEGKPVISLSRGFLGVARGLVIGAGSVGVRAVKRVDLYLAWMAYVTSLRRLGKAELAEELAKRIADPMTARRLPVSELPRVRRALEEAGAPEEAWRLLDEMIRAEREVVSDIPWGKVLKVADAVIVD